MYSMYAGIRSNMSHTCDIVTRTLQRGGVMVASVDARMSTATRSRRETTPRTKSYMPRYLLGRKVIQ